MDMRVVIADDDPLAQELLEFTLGRDDRFDVVGVVADGAQAIAVTSVENPDLLLLDIHMPGLAIEEVVSGVRRASPTTRIILVSGVHAEQAALICEQSGADAWLPKDMRPSALPARLHALAAI